MKPIILRDENGIDSKKLRAYVRKCLKMFKNARRILLLPPDKTRMQSRSGEICRLIYEEIGQSCKIDIMPALGTHKPMSEEELKSMFGDIPSDLFLEHDWKDGVTQIGEIPSKLVAEVSEGLMEKNIPVLVNKRLMDNYDAVISVGQVVPHEVAGMANYTKNILVGAGGSGMINDTHFISAVFGIERTMGIINTPVRLVLDYAQTKFLRHFPLYYMHTVIARTSGENALEGIYFGNGRDVFELAALHSIEKNITVLKKPVNKMVAFMERDEYRSLWLCNKSIYRTRRAIADGGELIVLAPGLESYGENAETGDLIGKYGYSGIAKILNALDKNADLRDNLSVAAHLIHGSTEGRFKVTYCCKSLGREDLAKIGFGYMDIDEAIKKYNPSFLKPGENRIDGEEIYFVPNPALGLWIYE